MDHLQDLKINKHIKILITGCAGFIGSNLLEFFLKKGAYVIGLDNFSTGTEDNIDSAVRTAEKENKKIRFDMVRGDIRDYGDCKNAASGADIVLHHAALGSVQRSIDDPLASNGSNIDGTLNMLKASAEGSISRFIFSSSSSVYGDTETLPKIETMVPAPKSIYAVTKLTGEYYCRLFYKLYKLKTITFRYFNVFGKRQDPASIYAAVIPIFINRAMEKKRPHVFGDGTQSRDFTYIDNVVYANYLAVTSEEDNPFGHCYNVACNDNISLNEMVTMLSRFFHRKIEPIYKEPRKADIKHSLADIERVGKDLGYKPLVYFEEGLSRTIKWLSADY